jgi:hypothetical protein
MQIDPSSAPRYRSIPHALLTIYQNEGVVRGLYKVCVVSNLPIRLHDTLVLCIAVSTSGLEHELDQGSDFCGHFLHRL